MSANSSLVPSSSDLLLLVPRLARNMVHLAQRFLPDQNMSAMAPDATPSQLLNMTASLIQQPVPSTAAAAAAAAATASTQASSTGFMSYLTLPWADGIKGFGGMFAYIGSRWALATFAISIFLNRTHFYASSRQNLNPRWHTRLLLYSGPVLLLSYHVLCILQTLKCQTSPDYPLLRYGDPNKNLAINFGGEGGFVHHFSSSLLFWKSDAECCRAMNMSLQDDKFLDVMGSFSLLWPLFLTLCFKVLLIALISCLSHISSAVLAIIGRRHQLRLVNTAVWAMCYMTAFCWSLVNALSSPLGPHDLGIIRFPTVCIIGFIPHMLIILGIMVCSLIYGVALLLNALSLPPHAPPNPSIKERFSIAFNNMQANVQFSSVSSMRLSWTEDFYTVLLKIGFNVLTAASESVFLNEGSKIQIHAMTWLEEERIQEFTSMLEDRRRASLVPSDLLDERIAKGLSFTDHKTMPSKSGFATERRSKSSADTASRGAINNDNGLGIAERRGRWQLSFEFMKGLLLLLISINGRLALSCLSMLGIERVPNWLTRAADYRRLPASASTKQRNGQQASTPDFWLVSERGVLSLPEDGNVDVEDEMRKRLRAKGLPGAGIAEDAVDDDLYQWWKRGGWWGDLDNSGSYETQEQDDDTTSMISMSTNAPSEADSEEDSGRKTPTQEDYIRSREQSPSGFEVADLARLLDPKTIADREEAQMLARHLQSEQPMTRSQYRRRLNRDKARVLDAPYLESAFEEGTDGAMSTAAEAETLEKFLLERRLTKRQQEPEGGARSWDSGAEGMGSSGPQCVVCQSSPRVIVAWPCGCLCVCDECRVGVATRNFTKCMCCRTKVVAFSRLFVP
ncbi:hypothetical protein D6D01_00143 [Aureobasidium pullulans]|uniref:Ubiquitin-protein ligase n=1 Tax=Aureobasidium pullulans TaxID=5580 RepID=A0A4S9M2Y6_AURPU|nr:hypothetical protein D6D01_00143 [Aureobasidium pullulans]